jgi:hypothetical protein
VLRWIAELLAAPNTEPGALLVAGSAMLTRAADAMVIAEFAREEAMCGVLEAEPTPA